MRKEHFLIMLLFFWYPTFGNGIAQKIKLPNRKVTEALQSKIRVNSQYLDIISFPYINFKDSIEFIEEIYVKKGKSYALRQGVLIEDSLFMTLKSGLKLNIEKELPEWSRKSFRKAMFNKKKCDANDIRNIKYLEFYSQYADGLGLNELIERFTRYMSVYKNGQKNYDILYEFQYNDQKKIEITRRELIRIESTSANNLE